MKTVQMTLDEELVKNVDKMVKKLKTTRSEFTRAALRDAIDRLNTSHLESKHRKGYKEHPVNKTKFRLWENEQNWGDE